MKSLSEKIKSGIKVIYVDETMFVHYKVSRKCWTSKGDPFLMKKVGLRLRPVAAIVGISY